MAKPAIEVRRFGQSIWLDSISRDMLTSGEFRRLVEQEGVSGCTSNPTIFDKAISGSSAYDDQIATLAAAGRDADAIFDELARADLQDAADTLRPVHDDTGGNDGFVSWEVSPELAYDTEATMREVRRLWALLDRPNALIKIPATRAGLSAIHEMLYEGINVNITLLFSITRYEEVMEAYLSALERRLAEGKPVDRIRSVASFFVSRVDTLVDKQLDAMMERASPAERQRLAALRSKVAIANAKLAYQRFKQIFAGPRWEALRARGAALQRPLWASTSTKDPSLPDTYYVDNLIGPHTVNTVPPHTLAAFNDHGRVAPTLEEGLAEAQEIMDRLAEVGIDIVAVTDQLEREGVRAFADSFVALRNTIDEKRARLRAGTEAAPRPF